MAFDNRFVMGALVLAVVLVDVLRAAPATDENGRADVICRLTKAPGICKAYIIRWRYNPETKKCEKFVFGGCRGNANNFEAEEDCMAVCRGI